MILPIDDALSTAMDAALNVLLDLPPDAAAELGVMRMLSDKALQVAAKPLLTKHDAGVWSS